jgi:hypothetical protein
MIDLLWKKEEEDRICVYMSFFFCIKIMYV